MGPESPTPPPEGASEAPHRSIDTMARLLLAAMNEVAQSFPDEFTTPSRQKLLTERHLIKVKYNIHKSIREDAAQAKERGEAYERVKGERETKRSQIPYLYPEDKQELFLTYAAHALGKVSSTADRLPKSFIDALIQEMKLRIQKPD